MAARWLVFLLYLGLVGLLGWIVGRRLRNAWVARKAAHPRTRGVYLFVFALLSLFFAGAVKQVVISEARFAARMFVEVPFGIVADPGLGARLGHGFGNDFSTVLSFVADGVRDAVRAANLGRLPFLSIVAFTALFIILTRLIAYAASPKEEAETSWMHAFWSTVGQRRRQNTYLAIVLLGAAYLSAAALMALPELTTSLPGDLATEKLRERLSAMQIAPEELERSYPEAILGKTPFDELRKDASELKFGGDTAPMVQTDPPEVVFKKGVLDFIAAGEVRREMLAQHWRDLRGRAVDLQRRAFDQALTAYENENMNRVGVRQTIEHHRSVIDWYQGTLVDARAALSGCQAAVQEEDGAWTVWTSSAASALIRMVAFSGKTGYPEATIPEAPKPSAALETYCVAPIPSRPMPRRAEAGTNLKPVFRSVSGWLVGQESLPLAMIVGMIGFALLGAAISSIVRPRREGRGPDAPLVSDLTSVVIRGVSAAVVVFLGVKGGLSLFGASDANVNPYVVLLTCLAAAVYSERAWQRVRVWFAPTSPPPADPPAPPAEG